MIQAIETRYNGYRFRSRLEARWAIFFDAMGLAYQYEPEAFRTSQGVYLPDFYVGGVYLEVKPEGYDVCTDEQNTSVRMADVEKCTGKSCFALCGEPWPEKHVLRITLKDVFGEEPVFAVLASCRGCDGLNWMDADPKGLAMWGTLCGSPTERCGEKCPSTDSGRIMRAFEADREYRFDRRGGSS